MHKQYYITMAKYTLLVCILLVGARGIEPPMFTLWEQIYSLSRHHHRRCTPMRFYMFYVEAKGIEPLLEEPKSSVLPLDDASINIEVLKGLEPSTATVGSSSN